MVHPSFASESCTTVNLLALHVLFFQVIAKIDRKPHPWEAIGGGAVFAPVKSLKFLVFPAALPAVGNF